MTPAIHPRDMIKINTADDLVAYVERRDHVTFAELHDVMPAMNELPIIEWVRRPAGKPEIVAWVGGQRGIEMIIASLDQRRLCVAAADILSYMIDGRVVRNKRGGVDRRWLPMCLRPAAFGVPVQGQTHLFDAKTVARLLMTSARN